MHTTALSSAQTFTAGITAANSLEWSDYLGIAIFVIGFLFEVVGDAQLGAHIADQDPNKGKFCKRGLWRYTRHPNYFGEALLWWGIYCFSFAVKGYWTFFSPLVITLLLRFLSGVPMLERKARKHPEWAQYEAETNTFFPWFWDKNAVPSKDE